MKDDEPIDSSRREQNRVALVGSGEHGPSLLVGTDNRSVGGLDVHRPEMAPDCRATPLCLLLRRPRPITHPAIVATWRRPAGTLRRLHGDLRIYESYMSADQGKRLGATRVGAARLEFTTCRACGPKIRSGADQRLSCSDSDRLPSARCEADGHGDSFGLSSISPFAAYLNSSSSSADPRKQRRSNCLRSATRWQYSDASSDVRATNRLIERC